MRRRGAAPLRRDFARRLGRGAKNEVLRGFSDVESTGAILRSKRLKTSKIAPLAFAVLTASIPALSLAAADEPEPYGFKTWFETDPKPEKESVTGNPLDCAGKRIGMDPRNFVLPRGEEMGYRFACRFPVIDSVMNQPLYMKQWSEDGSEALIRACRDAGPHEAIAEALRMLRGLREEAGPYAAFGQEGFAEFEAKLAASPFTVKFREVLGALLRAFLSARSLAAKGRANLTAEDLQFLEANPAYYLIPDGKTMTSLTGSVDTHLRYVSHARRIGFEYVFRGSLVLSAAVSAYAAALKGLAKPGDFFEDPKKAGETVVWETSAGLVVIAGFGNDAHERDAAVEIDLGGDDSWTNGAGACRSALQGAALAIDHRGNDRYAAADRSFVQGFGFLGTGILADLGGDDRYEARHFCQGAGIAGVGLLWDAGGDDAFVAHAFCQGAGMFGTGMLLESAGEDFYDCATLGQGGATTLGLGVLCDLGGDDRYHLNIGAGKDVLGNIPGYGQGGAVSFRAMPARGKLTPYGGVGMLVDAAGNDRYRTRDWNSQGGSYIMSLGVLYDAEGNDHYSAGTGQGSGIHITAAILVDKSGSDVYEGGFRTGGSGGDCSPGFLIDCKGDDTYVSGTSSYGTGCKPFSYSLFIDYEGDDRYICPEPKGRIWFNNWDSFGGVWPESDPGLWPYAICLDLGGKDEYRVRNRENDSMRHSFGHGIHIDTEWSGGDVIGPQKDPLEPYRDIPLPAEAAAHPLAADLKLLQHPDAFVRFGAVGRITAAAPDIAAVLAAAIMTSTHRGFNRDALECLHSLFVAGRIGPSQAAALAGLLKAADAEVRAVIADDFGIFEVREAGDMLIDAARSDPSPAVRRFAIRSLAAISSSKALPLASEMAEKEKDEMARRAAVGMLGTVRDGSDPLPLLVRVLEKDSSSPVRVTAATSLAALNDPRAIEPFRAAARSNDVYLQRAAAKGLANLFMVEGIEILIRSLSFPSIDAFFNYDYNVPNFISIYSGFELTEDQRYEQDSWMKWFGENRERIDIKANVLAYRDYQVLLKEIRDLKPIEQIQKYEGFLAKHPGHRACRKPYGDLLNQVAWDMATAPKGSPGSDPSSALKYALRAVEMNPHPNIIDTLAQAYEAAEMIDKAIDVCREALKKHPGEKMFLDRLVRYGASGK